MVAFRCYFPGFVRTQKIEDLKESKNFEIQLTVHLFSYKARCFSQSERAFCSNVIIITDQCLCSCSKDSLDAKAEDVFNLVILHPEDAPKWGGNITFSCVSISLITVVMEYLTCAIDCREISFVRSHNREQRL